MDTLYKFLLKLILLLDILVPVLFPLMLGYEHPDIIHSLTGKHE
jgi:hypothetical protein